MNIFVRKNNFLWQKVLAGIVAVAVLIVFLNMFQKQIRNSFYIISSPFSKVFIRSGKTASGFFVSMFNINSLKKENSNLKEENTNLLFQISLLQEHIKENQDIKNALQNTQSDNFKMVLAGVIGINANEDFVLIDKGSNGGISENMPVVSGEKVLYGKVVNVYENFSKVMLISNKISVLDVKVQNNDLIKTPVYGVAKGSGNLSLYLDLVNPDADIKEGNVLVSSGLEGIFPKDLLVGKVTSYNKNDTKPFQTAAVQPFFDTNNIDNLFVITDYLKK